MTLSAYLYTVPKSGRVHVRVKQDIPLGDAFAEDMRRCGSPAHWEYDKMEWDFPLTPAVVLALQKTADQHRLPLQWSPDLTAYVAHHVSLDNYERQLRMSIEALIKGDAPMPGYITNTLGGAKPPMRHQQIAYHWGLRVPGLFLAWDPGLGKSRAAIDICRGCYDSGAIRPMQQVWCPDVGKWGVRGGILVVTKSVVVRTIAIEFNLWQGMTCLEITGSKQQKTKRSALPAHAHCVNYESMMHILHNQYDCVVYDEVHSCANSSQTTENALMLAQHARKRLGLTGSPITNNLESAFFQMLIIDGGKALGASKTKFISEFFESERVGPQGITKNTAKDGASEKISEKMALCTYFLKKDECLKDLPAKTHTPLYLEMNEDQGRYYHQMKTEYLTYIQDSQVSAQQAAARMMKLRQIVQGFVLDDEGVPKDFNSSKVDTLIDMLKNKLTGRKVVVWAVFTHEINMLCKRLQAESIGYVRLDGTVHSKKDRDTGLKLWNNDPRVTVFIGQIQMGIGITLHARECEVPCFDCVYLGLDYSFVNWIQSQDRIHRVGQRFACSYTYLLTSDGVDRNIYQCLQTKQNTSNAVYRAGKEFYGALVRGDEPNLAAIDGAA